MGYLGRRIGLSQGRADAGDPSGGATGGGILDLFANGYFQREGNIYNHPGEPLSGLTATGGIINDYTSGSDIYRAHIFTSSGTFVVSALAESPTLPNNVEYLVVAGGGGGGGAADSGSYAAGGGGGAGGLRTNVSGHPLAGSAFPVSTSPGSYTVTVGGGGAGGTIGDGAPGGEPGTKGGNSVFGPITSIGGGFGGAPYFVPGGNTSTVTGGPGGSGGGAGTGPGGADRAGGLGNTPPSSPSQGNPGGGTTYYASGGGGGAGAAGEDRSNPPDAADSKGGAGGIGVRVLIAAAPGDNQIVGAPGPNPGNPLLPGWFAGGGGGGKGIDNQSIAGGTGGAWGGSELTPDHPSGPFAGGGAGGGDSSGTGQAGSDGTATTGGGGGGCGADPQPRVNRGGSGGSGVVVVRYKIGSVQTAKATGGAISFYGDKTIHTFTNSGTFATTSNWSAATVEYVVVGGGGAGGDGGSPGSDAHGGGGAGSYRTGTTPIGAHPVSTTIQVGAGAAAAGYPAGTGTPSYFGTPITAPGGGSGGASAAGVGGGSGGGGSASEGPNGGGTGSGDTFPGTIGATPANGWGNNGGAGPPGGANGGGGGGGGGAGGLGIDGGGGSNPGGKGGVGMQLPSTFRDPASTVGVPGPTTAYTNGDTSGKYWVAGGGGGGTWGYAGPQIQAGGGGAGDGASFAGGGIGGIKQQPNPPSIDASAGTTNTGGGGGGGAGSAIATGVNRTIAGKGGSGIVIIAYPT